MKKRKKKVAMDMVVNKWDVNSNETIVFP